MRPHRAFLALATVAICASCSSSTDPSAADDIVGSWVADSAASPTGSYVRQLILRPEGKFMLDLRSFGLYDNQEPDELSGYERTSGTFTVDGDRLILQPEWLAVWDFSFGRDAPQTIYAPYPEEHFYDDAHFHIQGDTLTLDFTLYEAGSPRPATQIYQRGS
jgi:hypothetical protein